MRRICRRALRRKDSANNEDLRSRHISDEDPLDLENALPLVVLAPHIGRLSFIDTEVSRRKSQETGIKAGTHGVSI
jgi:hypothetical protein